MALPIPQTLYTEEEYLTFERAAFERSEYLDGVIYAMAGESPNHGSISANLVALLVSHLRGTPCGTFTKDMKVRSGPLPASKLNRKGLFSYPDVVVVCGEVQVLDEHQDVITNPVLIVEVLSASTMYFDRVAKFQRYQKYLPLLMVYVLVSQDQPRIEVYQREAPGSDVWRYFFTDELTGTIHLPVIDCTLNLADVYDRVVFPPSAEDLEAEEPQA